MKHLREIKVGLLAVVCLFLLFFGFNFLKGVNIFTPTNSYHGLYVHLHGLEEQAAVSRQNVASSQSKTASHLCFTERLNPSRPV